MSMFFQCVVFLAAYKASHIIRPDRYCSVSKLVLYTVQHTDPIYNQYKQNVYQRIMVPSAIFNA